MDCSASRAMESPDLIRAKFDEKLQDWFADPKPDVPLTWKAEAARIRPLDYSHRFFASRINTIDQPDFRFPSSPEQLVKQYRSPAQEISQNALDENQCPSGQDETMFYSFQETEDGYEGGCEDGYESDDAWYRDDWGRSGDDEEMDVDFPPDIAHPTPSPTTGELLAVEEVERAASRKRPVDSDSRLPSNSNADKKRRLSSALSKMLDCEDEMNATIRELRAVVAGVRGDDGMFEATIADAYLEEDEEELVKKEWADKERLQKWILERQPLSLLEIGHLAGAIMSTK